MKNIEEVIEKYYNGETSLAEEKQLQVFFQGEDIPDHLRSHKDQFVLLSSLSQNKTEMSDDDLFAKIMSDKVLETKPTNKVISMRPWIMRVAAAVIFVLIGYGFSELMNKNNELNEMKNQLSQLQVLMLEQLESTSASGRLQAVSYSFQLSAADDKTIEALIEAMIFDENMHVRTKAVEALEHFSGEQRINEALAKALNTEEEPAVQIAIISALVGIKDKSAIDHLEKLSENENVLKDVRDEARLSIFKLKEM